MRPSNSCPSQLELTEGESGLPQRADPHAVEEAIQDLDGKGKVAVVQSLLQVLLQGHSSGRYGVTCLR